MEKIVVFLSTKQHLVITKENLPGRAETKTDLFKLLIKDDFIYFYEVIERVEGKEEEVVKTDHIVNTDHIVDVVIQ